MHDNDSSKSLLSEKSQASAVHDWRKRKSRLRWVWAPIAWLRRVISELVRSKSATIGVAIILLWVFLAITAPIISPYSPTEITGSKLEFPSGEHWLGTDQIGRDILSRTIWGTRVVLLLAPASVLLGLMIGLSLGLISGYAGGYVDMLIMRGCDILMSFPMLLIYILIITSIGASPLIVLVSVAIGAVPAITRIVRSLTLDEHTKDYISAARLRGERMPYILLREILPNVSGPIIVDAAIRVGYAIIAIGTLGFLGLGVPPPTPDWGGMINQGRQWIFIMPWVVLAPAAALSSVVIALTLLADGIREIQQQR